MFWLWSYIEMVNGRADVSCVWMAQYFHISYLFGELNLIIIPLANLWCNFAGKRVYLWSTVHTNVANLCEPATKSFGLMRNSWRRRLMTRFCSRKFAKQQCDHTFVAVCTCIQYSTEERNSYRFGITSWWVNDDLLSFLAELFLWTWKRERMSNWHYIYADTTATDISTLGKLINQS